MILPGFPVFTQSNVLGPELVTNGDFSSSAGWALGEGWSISGGQVLGSYGGSAPTDYASVTQASPVTLKPGMTVRVSLTLVSGTAGGSLNFLVGGSAYVGIDAPGTYTQDIQLGAVNNQELGFHKMNIVSGLVIDNFSVRIFG